MGSQAAAIEEALTIIRAAVNPPRSQKQQGDLVELLKRYALNDNFVHCLVMIFGGQVTTTVKLEEQAVAGMVLKNTITERIKQHRQQQRQQQRDELRWEVEVEVEVGGTDNSTGNRYSDERAERAERADRDGRADKDDRNDHVKECKDVGKVAEFTVETLCLIQDTALRLLQSRDSILRNASASLLAVLASETDILMKTSQLSGGGLVSGEMSSTTESIISQYQHHSQYALPPMLQRLMEYAQLGAKAASSSSSSLFSNLNSNGDVQGHACGVTDENAKNGPWPSSSANSSSSSSNLDPSLAVLRGEAALLSLCRITEDSYDVLDSSESGWALNRLVPLWLQLALVENGSFRELSLDCINCLLPHMPSAITLNAQSYLEVLSKLTQGDSRPAIRRLVCEGLSALLEHRQDLLLDHFENVAEFVLTLLDNEDVSVVGEACDFWTKVCTETSNPDALLTPFLPRLIPKLVLRIKLDEDTLHEYDEEQDNVNTPDRPEAIMPNLGKGHEGYSANATVKSFLGLNSNGEEDYAAMNGNGNDVIHDTTGDNGDNGDNSGYQADEEEENLGMGLENDLLGSGQWTLRSTAALCIDRICESVNNAPQKVLPIILPILNECFSSQDWILLETGILLLGSIADGCMEGMYEHLPRLLPVLINYLESPYVFVRVITCWAIGQYSTWLMLLRQMELDEANEETETDAGPNTNAITNDQDRLTFKHVLACITLRLRDSSKKVVISATSAIMSIVEKCGDDIGPFFRDLVNELVRAYTHLPKSPQMTVLDAMSVILDNNYGLLESDPDTFQLIMKSIWGAFLQLDENAPDFHLMMWTVKTGAQNLPTLFAPYAADTYKRAIELAQSPLIASVGAKAAGEELGDGDYDTLISSLELISGLVTGLGVQFWDLLQQVSSPDSKETPEAQLLELVQYSCQEEDWEVKRSAYGVLGDFAKHCPKIVLPHLGEVVPVLVEGLDDEYVGACNNSMWTFGSLALCLDPSGVQQMGTQCIGPCCRILVSEGLEASLRQNASICLGNIAKSCPAMFEEFVAEILKDWCKVLASVDDEEEKFPAYQGLVRVLDQHSNLIPKHFGYIVATIASYPNPPPELRSQFEEFLNRCKNLFESRGDWRNRYCALKVSYQTVLSKVYGITA